MSGIGQKLKVILWKCYILRKRHWLLSLFEVIAPLLLFYFFTKYSPSEQGKDRKYTIFGVSHLNYLVDEFTVHHGILETEGPQEIAFTPYNQFTKDLMYELEETLNQTSLKGLYKTRHFLSEKEMNTWLNKQDDQKDLYKYTGIVFDKSNTQAKLKYTLRVHKENSPPISELFGWLGFNSEKYYNGMFIIMQMLIDMSFIRRLTGNFPNIGLQRFPVQGLNPSFANAFFPLITTFSFVFIMPAILKKIVEEKITGIKEFQKMMGLHPWMLWTGWAVHSLMIYSISAIILTIMFRFPWSERSVLLYQVDTWIIIWCLFMLFIVSMILYCFAVSTFFSSPNIAMIAGILLWIIPTLSFLDLLVFSTPARKTTQLATCLSPPICLSWAFTIFINFQHKGKVWSWSMFFEKGTTGGLSMANIILMFFFDCFLFGIITWYMDCVKPGPFGRAKPFYFIFQFWKKDSDIIGSSEDQNQENFEEPPPNTKIGISIQNLRKVFGSKVAVDKVNLDIYEGEITALLGHNGAGKTTTMSILTGLFSPSKGVVIVDGKNIFLNMDQFQHNLGLCPQHNLLFTYLTVIEHLIFFGMLKGLSRDCAEVAGLNLLIMFHMVNMGSEFVSKLSGGMKRKLCLSIALMGDPKVLMLDEPTSGMDPESRREVWNILLSYRGERTILITTHYMEEADVLGDRIAIMDHGRVSCYGTSIFLKRLYGTGYHIIISKDVSKSETAISTVVESQLHEPKLKSNLPTQLTYNVTSNDAPKFSLLFEILEKKKSELGITGISIACTTMEDVFLRVAEGGLPYNAIPAEVLLNSATTASMKERVEGMQLQIQQLKALFFKKMLVLYRTWFSTLIFVLIPLFSICVVLSGGFWLEDEQADQSAEMSLEMYGDTVVPYTLNYHKDMVEIYQGLITEHGSKFDEFTGNINKGLILKIEEDKSYYYKAVVGAEFNKSTITCLYNNLANHAAPISLNLITNTILKGFNPSGSITVVNHPFLGKAQKGIDCDRYQLMSDQQALLKVLPWLIFACGLMIIMVRFISLPLIERANNAKQLQLMTGLSPLIYWLSHFIWDFLLYFGSTLLVTASIWLLDADKDFTPSGKMGLLFFLILLYGISGIPFCYLVTFITTSSAKATSLFLIFHLLTGIIAPLITLAIDQFYEHLSKENSRATFELVNGLLCLNPLYAETAALLRLLTVMIMDSVCYHCSKMCDTLNPFDKREKNSWSILQYVTFLMTEWVLYWLLIFLIEFGLLKMFWAKVSSIWIGPMFKYTVTEDEDVLQETQKAKSFFCNNYNKGNQNTPVLKVCGLGKKYCRKSVAVHEVNFLVEKGQCFGLLGVNGAGKTTTFKMLTSEETPTVGAASIFVYDLVRDKYKYLREIGYCPQFDAIIEVLTGEEMLRLFAVLRGTPLHSVDTEVDNLVHFMGIEEYAKAPCGKYSGGNKRKLSTAIALIGDPPVVFLDEPTAGVDPVSRRKLWDVLVQCQKTGQAIVLTSHSMEECEALCSRLTILVGGHMKCIGSTQYLKQKFGQGYTIRIKLSSNCPDLNTALNALKNAVNKTFSNCFIKDEHKGLLHYHIADNSIFLSVLFSKLEELRQNHMIMEDYTVGDTTLEQVFISFAKQVPPAIEELQDV